MPPLAERGIPGKSLCKGLGDTWIRKGVHAAVLKRGSTGKLKKAGVRRCTRTLKASLFSKFAQEEVELTELSSCMPLSVQFISWITTKLCDL